MKHFTQFLHGNQMLLLSHRDFSILWTAQTFSGFGDNIFRVAQIVLLIQITGSSVALSGLLFVTVLPNILLTLFGGVLADRFDRRLLLLIANSIRGFLMLLITLIVWLGLLQVWHLYVLAFLYGGVSAFANPAFDAILPNIVQKDQLQQANSMFMLGDNIASIVGPGIGGFIIALSSPTFALLINTISFFILVFSLRLIQYRQTIQSEDQISTSIFSDIQKGVQFVWKNSALLSFLILFAIINIAGATLNVGLPILITKKLNLDISAYGWFLSAMNVGIFIGISSLGFLKFKQRGLAISLSIILMGIFGYVLLALTNQVWLSIFAVAIIDGLSMIPNILFPSWIQTSVPENLRGRVFAFIGVTSYSLVPLGLGLSAIFISIWGVSTTLFFMGCLLTVAGLCVLLISDVRNLN